MTTRYNTLYIIQLVYFVKNCAYSVSISIDIPYVESFFFVASTIFFHLRLVPLYIGNGNYALRSTVDGCGKHGNRVDFFSTLVGY